MPRFEFRLQKLLDYRAFLEKEAERHFLEARSKTIAAELAANEIEGKRSELSRSKCADDLAVRIALQNAIDRLDDDFRSQRAIVGVLEAEEDQFRTAWLAARKETQTLLKLHESALAEWALEETRREQAALDEWAVLRRIPA